MWNSRFFYPSYHRAPFLRFDSVAIKLVWKVVSNISREMKPLGGVRILAAEKGRSWKMFIQKPWMTITREGSNSNVSQLDRTSTVERSSIRISLKKTYLRSAVSAERHKLRKERCIEAVCRILMADVKRTLITPQNPPYAMAVNFKAIFPLVVRDKIVFILGEVGASVNLLSFLAAVLQENGIIIDDATAELPSFPQTVGLPQGKN